MVAPFLMIIFIIIFSILIGFAVYAIIEAVQQNKRNKHVIVGGCLGTRWGCCPDQITPKYDQEGTNCIPNLMQDAENYLE